MHLPHRALAAALTLACAASASAQSYTWTTVAGIPAPRGATDGAGSNARFYLPWTIAADAAGNLYVADTNNHTIRKITAAGVVSTLAGAAGQRGSTDGTGPSARFARPFGLAVDASGVVFVADYDNATIRRITPAGVVSTLAGAAGLTGAADGTGSTARFNGPQNVAVDGDGNIYVADRLNRTVRKITAAGVVSTLAGVAGVSGSADGAGSAARFSLPASVAVDSAGDIYVSDNGNSNIRKVTPAGVVSTIAGLAGSTGATNGAGTAARFSGPNGIVVDGAGNLFVADSGSDLIRKVAPDGTVTTFAGFSGTRGNSNGTGTAARFFVPCGVALDAAGNLCVADTNNHSIRKITPAGVVSTLAGGGGSFGGTDGLGAAARFNSPRAVAVDRAGNLLVTDSLGYTLRRVTPGGSVTTLAGLAGTSLYNDGLGTAARFVFPWGVVADGQDNIYIVDDSAATLRRMSPSGLVVTLAGSPLATGGTDGATQSARFSFPRGAAIDGDGNVFVADSSNHTIRKVTPAGVVSTVAGLAGTSGAIDGSAASARFTTPSGVAVDAAGNLYVADVGNSIIRKISSAGDVTTLAGLAGVTGTTDGTGPNARFLRPYGVAVDNAGNVFAADTDNHLIRKITPAGVVTTIGGAATDFFATDGTGTNAHFFYPMGITVTGTGVIYVTDGGENILVRGALDAKPVIALQPLSLPVTAGSRVTFNVGATGGGLSYQWYLGNNPVAGATTSTLTLDNAQSANAGIYTVAVSNSAGSTISAAAALTLVNATDTGRIGNLAIRSVAGTGGQTLIVGLAIGGAGTNGTKPVLIRGVGPALGAFGLTGFLADPRLEVYASNTGAKINENDNWSGDTQVASTSASVGAFSLGAGTSRDAALYLPAFPIGSYTVQVSGVGGTTGVALAEIYDALAAGSFTAATPRLVNVSARTQVGTGGDVLIAGFYIGGQTAKTVLIRAIGPTLTAFGVPGALADPKLELFSGQTKINENDNWGGDAALSASFGNVGAFPLSPTSLDAALLVTLAPGGYTAQISGVGGTTGVALVEVYDVP